MTRLTDVLLWVILVEVDTADVHGCVGGWGRDDDLLGTTLQVEAGLLLCGEDTGRLDDVIGASLSPGDVCWILKGRDGQVRVSPPDDLAGRLQLFSYQKSLRLRGEKH